MSVEISERTIGLWFMSLNETTDFLAGLESTEEGFLLQYRFRYYKEESPWSDKDEKHWYTVRIDKSKSKAEAIQSTQIVVQMLEQKSGQQCDELLVKNGDIGAFMRELHSQRWAHMKFEKKEDAA
jgi:hypothetical protein